MTSRESWEELRGIPLLAGERVEELFDPKEGLVADMPQEGHILVLTNQRVVSFTQGEGRKEALVAPLGELRGVTVKTAGRSLKPLTQGLVLVVAGVLAYLIIGTFVAGVPLASAVGSIIALIGILLITRYLFWEEEGSVTFQSGSWELNFPYRSQKAGYDVYTLVNRFFQLKLGARSISPED